MPFSCTMSEQKGQSIPLNLVNIKFCEMPLKCEHAARKRPLSCLRLSRMPVGAKEIDTILPHSSTSLGKQLGWCRTIPRSAADFLWLKRSMAAHFVWQPHLLAACWQLACGMLRNMKDTHLLIRGCRSVFVAIELKGVLVEPVVYMVRVSQVAFIGLSRGST